MPSVPVGLTGCVSRMLLDTNLRHASGPPDGTDETPSGTDEPPVETEEPNYFEQGETVGITEVATRIRPRRTRS
ncbi:MAG: hypothetical protein U5K28_05300 [Halobacteriales archaeon]|nr:hypothetical protein [Halobacteriales archaeon]